MENPLHFLAWTTRQGYGMNSDQKRSGLDSSLSVVPHWGTTRVLTVFSAVQSTLPGCGRAVSSSWVLLTVTLLSDLTSVFPGRYQTEKKF